MSRKSKRRLCLFLSNFFLTRIHRPAALSGSCCCLRTSETFERPELWEPVAIKRKKKRERNERRRLSYLRRPLTALLLCAYRSVIILRLGVFSSVGNCQIVGPHIDEASAGDARSLARSLRRFVSKQPDITLSFREVIKGRRRACSRRLIVFAQNVAEHPGAASGRGGGYNCSSFLFVKMMS